MTAGAPDRAGDAGQLRLLLEELCCDLCRFEHAANDGVRPEDVRIDRECALGTPGAFADLRVAPTGLPPYVVEVKFGYSTEDLLRSLRRKYSCPADALRGVGRIVLVTDLEGRAGRADLEPQAERCLHENFELEVWDERRLSELLRRHFGVELKAVDAENLLHIRHAVDRTIGFYAFGGPSPETYEHDPLKAELLWHFGFSRLRQIREAGRVTPRDVLPPGTYRGAGVLIADLCSFSSYVRDTPDSAIVRESLTSFYSKARYQILDGEGMVYQFVGDQVIGLFGLPERTPDYLRRTLEVARVLADIGDSISHHWQRRIDRVQTSGGLHLGLAIGDLQIVSLRPFSRTHVGAIGDCINIAARLTAAAKPGEIVISNSFHDALAEEDRAGFEELEPVEARNVGRIKAWGQRRGQGRRMPAVEASCGR
ncbi:MAG TPA: adenylate/guanylate cyclase domain-containing protein [Planctomycetaceae bacterium]